VISKPPTGAPAGFAGLKPKTAPMADNPGPCLFAAASTALR